MTIEKDALARLHDAILGVFGIDANEDQIMKLLKLYPNYDGTIDTFQIDQFTNKISYHFLQMEAATFGDSKAYKNAFKKKLEKEKPKILKFIA